MKVELKITPSNIKIFSKYNTKLIRLIKTLPQWHWTGYLWEVPTIYEKQLLNLLKVNNIQTSFIKTNSMASAKMPNCHCYHDFVNEGIKLYPYQTDAINTFLRNNSIILNFDIGSGKTITAILCALKSKYKPPYLVITRAALISEFKQEIDKFTPQHKNKFTIISYEKYRNKPSLYQQFDLIIMDEVTKFKNYQSKLYASLKSMRHKSFIFLTGLLLENNLQELYAILSIFKPSLFHNFWDFKNRYLITTPGDYGGFKVTGHKNIDNLLSILDTLRVTAHPVLLPTTTYTRYYELGTYKQLYNELREEAESKSTSFGAVVQLKQLAISPYLLSTKYKTGGKVDSLLDIINECGDKKIIIFCFYKKIHPLLRTILPTDTQYISSANKNTLHTNSQIIVSTDCLAYGKNLQDYKVIINLDIPWNPGVLKQRIGRIHRVGQTVPPIIFNLIMNGTIDEEIMGTVKKKTSTMKLIHKEVEI